MVVDHDHVEPQLVREVDLRDGRGAAVGGDEDARARAAQRADRVGVRPVALAETVGHVGQRPGTEVAQALAEDRRRREPVDVEVAEDRDRLAGRAGALEPLDGGVEVRHQRGVGQLARRSEVIVRLGQARPKLAEAGSPLRTELERNQGFAARFYRAIAVFLSDRLRSTVGQLGYGVAQPQDAEEAFALENELDDGLLDNLHVAGDRMLRLIAILDGRRV